MSKPNDHPLVSGITIFFNGENFLEEAIRSVLAQTYANWELLLVDDGSKDSSTETAQRYARAHPDRIRYLEHSNHENRGKSASRNLGLCNSRGKYIAFLDHDDIWLPNKLEDQVALLEAHPEAGMMYGRTRFWHGWTGRPEDRDRDSFTDPGVEPNSVIFPPRLITLFLRDEGTVASTCSVLVRRDLAQAVGGFDEAFRDQYEDMVFFARLYLETPVFVSDACWDYYRQHGANSCAKAVRSGVWHPSRPSSAREVFLNSLEQLVREKGVNDPELIEALEHELWPYRHRDERNPRQVFCDLCSDAALALLRGEDARTLLDALGDVHDPQLNGETVAAWLCGVLPPVAIGDPGVWTMRWPSREQLVRRFMESLERQACVPGLADESMKIMERRVRNRWQLRVVEGNAARLAFPLDEPDRLRIAIDKGDAGNAYDVQLNEAPLRVKAGDQYAITFLARADSDRNLSFGLAKAHQPWSNLGLHRQVSLTVLWQSFEETFAVTEDDDRARLYFDLGGSNTSIELSAIVLRSLTEGCCVDPYLVPFDEPLARTPDESAIDVGKVQFGSFLRLTPISREFGADRGLPIDRHYIERFLGHHARDIQGHVLEIEDDGYTRLLGDSRVTRCDILHVTEGNPEATIVADLANAPQIPSNTFDCIILVQTLQLIADVHAAIATLHRILKPGGVLLATFPGVSHTDDREWKSYRCWSFAPAFARRLFAEVFRPTQVRMETFGNVLTAVSFLHGISAGELTASELDYSEPCFAVTIGIRAAKAAANQVGDRSSRSELAEGPGLVLMYHRVADTGADPFSLCVTPDHFSEHLEVLRSFSSPIRLRQLTEGLHRGRLPRRSVVLTFDDGYADNLLNARPLLGRYDVPATVFITTGHVGAAREFWWDELQRIFLEPGTLPDSLRLEIGGSTCKWELGDAAHYCSDDYERCRRWKFSEGNAPTTRQSLYAAVWKLLRSLPDNERREVLDELLAWAGIAPDARPGWRSLLPREVVELADGGLVEVGAHTITHPSLTELARSGQEHEVRQSKTCLEEVLGRPVLDFSYPFGDWSRETADVVRRCGLTCACTTENTTVKPDTDPFALPRMMVEDCDGEEFRRQLERWFNDSGIQQ